MKYRAEIDGLRALAVIPVILFHAGFALFSGGFVGVDVFFVISGYLITTILIEDLDKNRFSIIEFYERRARRILPALFFVMVACIPFAWALMTPNQMKSFSQSFVAVSFFASNILFWKKSGYFASAAEEIPLLHTWSLAVEEQYYVIFPIFLLIGWRFGRTRLFWVIVLLTVMSLVLSEWAARNYPSANFYLAPTRAWELLAGSIAAFIVRHRGVQSSNFLSIFGLSAILFAIFAYDEGTPFPSIYTLVPVLGVVLLVVFGDKNTLAARLLSNKSLVGVGLISYSAYLWHQPIFAFVRISYIEDPPMVVMATLSAASLALALVSWRYIENPFRNKQKITKTAVFTGSIVSMVLLTVFGLLGHTSAGYESRYDQVELDVFRTAAFSPKRSECHFPQEESSLNRAPCGYFNGEPSVAVFGNSHAAELAYTLARDLDKQKIAVQHNTMSGCNHNYGKDDEIDSICHRWTEGVVDSLIANPAIHTVVVSYRNEGYLKHETYRKSLVDLLQHLIDGGKQVLYVLQAPLPGAHIDKYIKLSFSENSPNVAGLRLTKWNAIYKGKAELLDELPDEVVVIDPSEVFCMNAVCSVIRDSNALYFDDDHMSVAGSSLIAREIAKRIVEEQRIEVSGFGES